jgi:uncharacterized protein
MEPTPRKGIALWVLVAAFALVPQCAQAVDFPNKPPKEDFFVDQAHLINDGDRKTINATASALLKQERIPLFVVTIPSLSAYEASGAGIEQYARDLFDHWGIGSPDRNYGILLLVSVGDRKARIELGAGFEHRYDPQADDIMQSLIVPAFKRGDFSTGITDGVRGLDAMARGLQLPKPTPPWWFWPLTIGGLIFVGLLIYNLFKSGRSGWAWALIAALAVLIFFLLRTAASSGSSGGFGGGSSGGGGATGSW